jgi:hypothetical protein
MAVTKHAQQVVSKVVSGQHIRAVRLPEHHHFYEALSEMPNITNEVAPPTTGNLSQLLTGMAQHFRVNNPYRYTETDEYGESTYKPQPWACYKDSEVGGNKTAEAGALFAHYFLDRSVNGAEKRRPVARIYYSMHTHMHRVSSMRRRVGNGGVVNILFEEDGGYKHYLDGFSRTSTPGYWVQKGFKTMEQAVDLR